MRSDIRPIAALGALFVLPILGGVAVSGFYGPEYQAFGSDVENPVNSVLYVALILGFTAGILVAVKLRGRKVIKALFLGITGFTVYIVLVPIFALAAPEAAAVGLAFDIAFVLTYLLWRFPEWYVIDTAGALMCVGLTAILGISFGILPALLLLLMLAVYDAIAVYQTKHMIDLADTVMSESLPIMFVVPKRAGYSFLRKRKGLKEQLASKEERDALFMGLGDVIIPGALVVSSYRFLDPGVTLGGVEGPLAVALVTLVGGVIGFALLMRAVLKGNPQAGLPLLNGGVIAAYAIGSFAVYGALVV